MSAISETTSVAIQGGCPWCSNPSLGSYVIHGGACPLVAEIEYHHDGTVKRVRFREEPKP